MYIHMYTNVCECLCIFIINNQVSSNRCNSMLVLIIGLKTIYSSTNKLNVNLKLDNL